MKRLLAIILSVAATAATYAQTPEAAQNVAVLNFEKIEIEAGQMRYKGPSHEFVYHFSNTGNAPLVISYAEATCNCIKVNYSKKPVMPGCKGEIKVKYTPKKAYGHFRNKILVYSNGVEHRHVLLLTGEVVK